MKALLMIELKKGFNSTLISSFSFLLFFLIIDDIFVGIYPLVIILFYLWGPQRKNPLSRLENVLPIDRRKVFLLRFVFGVIASVFVLTIMSVLVFYNKTSQTDAFMSIEKMVYWAALIGLLYTKDETAYKDAGINTFITIGIIVVGFVVLFKTTPIHWPMERLAIRIRWLLPLLLIGFVNNYSSFMKSGYGIIPQKNQRRRLS